VVEAESRAGRRLGGAVAQAEVELIITMLPARRT
jgi:hypothetical protein